MTVHHSSDRRRDPWTIRDCSQQSGGCPGVGTGPAGMQVASLDCSPHRQGKLAASTGSRREQRSVTLVVDAGSNVRDNRRHEDKPSVSERKRENSSLLCCRTEGEWLRSGDQGRGVSDAGTGESGQWGSAGGGLVCACGAWGVAMRAGQGDELRREAAWVQEVPVADGA